MKLRRVNIENFRSIKSVTIDFDPGCRVLVGINESGKSNIIRALALLEPDRTPDVEDLRNFPAGEALDQEAFVRFVFALEPKEVDELNDVLAKEVLTDKPNMHIIEVDGKGLSLRQFCAVRAEPLYRVGLRETEKDWRYWTWKRESSVPAHIMKPKKGGVPVTVTTSSNGSALLSSYKLVDIRGREEELADHLEAATPEYIANWVAKAAGELAEENHPSCILWSYQEDKVLPGKVSIAGFAADPDTCPALKSMFELADITEIKEAILAAQKRANGMRQLLDRVAKKATAHFHEVWREYKDIRFLLAENGTAIDAVIDDVCNPYGSSGFGVAESSGAGGVGAC